MVNLPVTEQSPQTSDSWPGRSAVITGAGRGIGEAIARRLGQDGFHLILNDRDADPLEGVAANLRDQGCRAVAVVGDVTVPETNEQLVQVCLGEYGRLDAMVTNAGIVQVASIEELTPELLQRVFEINVFATLYGIRSAARAMRRQGSGKIITCASVAGHAGSAFMASYCASKAAVISLTQSAARELAPYGITVNSYCPGAVATDMWTQLAERLDQYADPESPSPASSFVSSIPLGRMQTPEDVGSVVSFLAGPDSSYMTGQSVIVDGGIFMQ